MHQTAYKHCWGFRLDGSVVVSTRKSVLTERPELMERDYFGSPATRIEWLPAHALESLVEDRGYQMIDLDAETLA